jgi:phage FluMu gp28-like protein
MNPRPIQSTLSSAPAAEGGRPEAATRGEPATPAVRPMAFRSYQEPVYLDQRTGILVLHWARQVGKSFTLAAWAVDRLLHQLARFRTWLIVVLSNSRDNGAEFVLKCGEICTRLGVVMEAADVSPDLTFANMRMEIKISMGGGAKAKGRGRTAAATGRVGRIKVLAANPRTARGFSGDLILDEFAFHEDSSAIWEAAEPILSANPEYLCRIASTGNGKHNMFYRLVTSGRCPVSRVSRTDAWRAGVKVYDPVTRQPITPEEARAKALDKRAYDQNYELSFNDENMALLTHELISAAERTYAISEVRMSESVNGEAGTHSFTNSSIHSLVFPICEQAWAPAVRRQMTEAEGDLFAGLDIGRHRDLSVLTVLEQCGRVKRVVGLLRMSGLRLPAQQAQIEPLCALPRFRRLEGDMTGLGLGLIEYAQEKFGNWRIRGVNFSATEPVSARLQADGKPGLKARVTEIMAQDLLAEFEDRTIEIPVDAQLQDDLRKPEKITSPGGQVSIAAVRDEAGHADHFWSLALAVRAANHAAADGLRSAADLRFEKPIYRPVMLRRGM